MAGIGDDEDGGEDEADLAAADEDLLAAAADLLHQADLAMYRAKREAADSVAIYDPRLEG